MPRRLLLVVVWLAALFSGYSLRLYLLYVACLMPTNSMQQKRFAVDSSVAVLEDEVGLCRFEFFPVTHSKRAPAKLKVIPVSLLLWPVRSAREK